MLPHFFKLAWRNLSKRKLYTFINALGLSLGIGACLLIGMYIHDEMSYDRFQKNADRIARVTMEYQSAGTVNRTAVTGTKVGPLMKRVFPQVEAYARLIRYERTVARGNTVFDEKNILYADKDFFRIFSFRLLQGDPGKALEAPYSIVLTESAARRYFGSSDPLGQALRLGGSTDYQVTGVVADPPRNSQIDFDLLASFSSLPAFKTDDWWTANYLTYVLTRKPDQIPGLETQLKGYMKNEVSLSELRLDGSDYLTYHLEPLTRVHLYSTLDGLTPNGSIRNIYVLGIIALLILFIACVNYTNLAIAQSVSRSTEVGIRKVLGSGRWALISQFLGESLFVGAAALLLALLAAGLLLPLFDTISGKQFDLHHLVQPFTILLSFLLLLLVVILAGAYPSFVLSRSGMAGLLRSGVRIARGGGGLRKSLIVFQFMVSVFLMISTLVVWKQISYINSRDIGYNKNEVIVLPVDSRMHQGYADLKAALSAVPGVVSVSGAYEEPSFIQWGDGITANNGREQKKISVHAIPVDLGFIPTLGMHMLAGNDFRPSDFSLQDTSHEYASYQNAYILNETAVRELGWSPEQAIGQIIDKGVPGPVRGVVKDFNFASLHEPIGPLVMFLDSSMTRELFVRVNASAMASTLKGLEGVWKERINYRPFDYHFLDEDFNRLYQNEQRTASLFSVFSSLALLLACLGLFALAAYSSLQRKRETGIRKILGASTPGLFFLLAKEFLVLVGISILAALPLAWLVDNHWLQGFAYRIDFPWWVLGLSSLLALGIALLTVSFHAIRAATMNPVDSIRTP